ncbi:hypothetical protein Efla_001155 [Eimeria flavescens]
MDGSLMTQEAPPGPLRGPPRNFQGAANPPRSSSPLGPPEAPPSSGSLVRTTKAQSLRERWNTYKLQGLRGPLPTLSGQRGPPGGPPKPAAAPHRGQGRRVADFIERNRTAVSQSGTRKPGKEAPTGGPLLLRHKDFGRTPKYLKVLREALQQTHRKQQLAEQQQQEAPAGLRRVSDEERQQLLTLLLQRKEQAEQLLQHEFSPGIDRSQQAGASTLLLTDSSPLTSLSALQLACSPKACKAALSQFLFLPLPPLLLLLQQELRQLPIALKTERQRLRSDELERLLIAVEKQLLKVNSKHLFVEEGGGEETIPAAPPVSRPQACEPALAAP